MELCTFWVYGRAKVKLVNLISFSRRRGLGVNSLTDSIEFTNGFIIVFSLKISLSFSFFTTPPSRREPGSSFEAEIKSGHDFGGVGGLFDLEEVLGHFDSGW